VRWLAGLAAGAVWLLPVPAAYGLGWLSFTYGNLWFDPARRLWTLSGIAGATAAWALLVERAARQLRGAALRPPAAAALETAAGLALLAAVSALRAPMAAPAGLWLGLAWEGAWLSLTAASLRRALGPATATAFAALAAAGRTAILPRVDGPFDGLFHHVADPAIYAALGWIWPATAGAALAAAARRLLASRRQRSGLAS
jgi:hypothetical protein